jgi:hypothetical protein
MSEVYSVLDLDGYADAVRSEAASLADSSLGKETDLNEFITLKEVSGIIILHSLGYDSEDNHIIDHDTHNDIVDEIQSWIFNIGLAKLAGSNKIECAWDDNLNDMVFWLSNNGVNTNNGNKQSE